MKLGIACLAFVFACGPASTGDDVSADDADGDGISDVDEGRASNTDTDGDGTPDYLDDDSDNDGIEDYREAGDVDAASPPIDTDGDGTPDFRDLDSDGNGRLDAVDGLQDIDGDGKGNFADLDDDNDGMDDLHEIGPNPDQPADFDGDGTPDFQDTDSDNDTILDVYEGSLDDDGDGAGNYLDGDSDGDCVPDLQEARLVNGIPADTDADHRYDFIDRDSDGDGVLDAQEDANCNGVVDTGETNPTNGDTDGDGVTDLVEVVAGTDPNNAASNPQANGDYVFVEPYQAPQSPLDDDLDFKTNLQAVDMYVILDRSGSMATEITTVKNNLATVVNNLTCAPLGAGAPPNCIPDVWAGAGTVGYSGSGADAYHHHVDIQPNPSFAGIPTTEPSGCCSEPLTFSAYSAITGDGGTNFGFTGVSPRTTCAGSPANNAGYVGTGYPCFRTGALPVVLLATDEPPLTGVGTNPTPNWATIVKPEYTSRKARLVGILGDTTDTTVRAGLETMATDTGAIDAANNNLPLVFDGAGSNAAGAIQTGILRLANGLPLDINAVGVDDTSDTVDAIASFVDHLETLQLGTTACASGLTDQDTNGDTFKDAYVDVQTGTPVCWKVVSKQNVTVPATDQPQLFRAKVRVFGDGVTQLDERDVFFLVPPAPVDTPLN